MKKVIRMILSVFVLILTVQVFVSCDSEDGVPSLTDSTLTPPEFEKNSGKYEITDEASPYSSVELGASGNYIVTRSDYRSRAVAASPFMMTRRAMDAAQSRASENNGVIYGTYTVTPDGKFDLEGFGVLELVSDGKNGQITELKITPAGQPEMVFTAKKAPTVGDDEMTNALCRTWVLKKCIDMEIDIATKDTISYDEYPSADWPESESEYLEVMFSKSGTYLQFFGYGELEAGFWRWEDQANGTIRYSYPTGYGYEKNSGIIKVSFSGNTMTVYETVIDDGIRIEVYSVFEDENSPASGEEDKDDATEEQPLPDTPANRVFKGNFPKEINGAAYTYTDGYLTKIVDRGNVITFTYTQSDVEIVAEGMRVEAKLSNWDGEKGLITDCTFWLGGEQPMHYAFQYDAERHCNYIAYMWGEQSSKTALVWENGNLVRVSTDDGYAPSDYRFEYSEIPNTNNIMFFESTYRALHFRELEFLYWTGMLGMPSKELPSASYYYESGTCMDEYRWEENAFYSNGFKTNFTFGK